MRFFPNYLAAGNPAVKMTRDPDCHATADAIAIARDFVGDVGSRVVLTVIPNIHGCFTQAREVAEGIGAEVALVDRTDYSSWDGSGHLDSVGSAEFTADFIKALERTDAFKAIATAPLL